MNSATSRRIIAVGVRVAGAASNAATRAAAQLRTRGLDDYRFLCRCRVHHPRLSMYHRYFMRLVYCNMINDASTDMVFSTV